MTPSPFAPICFTFRTLAGVALGATVLVAVALGAATLVLEGLGSAVLVAVGAGTVVVVLVGAGGTVLVADVVGVAVAVLVGLMTPPERGTVGVRVAPVRTAAMTFVWDGPSLPSAVVTGMKPTVAATMAVRIAKMDARVKFCLPWTPAPAQ